jgi:UrcA family protein
MNTTKGREYTAVTTAAGLLLLWAGAGINDARARGPLDETREMIVTAKDLDLSRPDNIRILYKRIWAAATYVCKPYNGDQAGSKVAWDSCRDATITYTVARFNVPALEDYYLTTTNRRPKTTELASQR